MRTWHWAGRAAADRLGALNQNNPVMKHTIVLLPSVALAVTATLLLAASHEAAPAAVRSDARDQIERGRHLVQDVALCADCHAPRLPTGEFDRARWLQGAPIGFKPTMEMPWTLAAPPLAGLANYTDEQVRRVLTTGVRPDGSAPLPPMPAFHLQAEEADAVIAYLRSLPSAK